MLITLILALVGLSLVVLDLLLLSRVMGIGGYLLLFGSWIHFFLSSSFVLSTGYAFLLFALFLLLLHFSKKYVKKALKRGALHAASQKGTYQAGLYMQSVIGKKGIATTDINPSGHIFLDQEYFRAFSPEDSIERGEKVEIIGNQDFVVFVKKSGKK